MLLESTCGGKKVLTIIRPIFPKILISYCLKSQEVTYNIKTVHGNGRKKKHHVITFTLIIKL